jgi:hypothetical protein
MGKYKEGVNPLLLEALQPEGESDPTKVMQAYAKLLIYASRNLCALYQQGSSLLPSAGL